MNEATAGKVDTFPMADRIRVIDMEQPWIWLALGWKDLLRSPALSIAYGALFTAVGFVIVVGLRMAGLDYLIYPLTSGFLLGGPILAVGLYEISRRHGRGERSTAWGALTAWRANPYHILTAGLVMMLFAIIWSRLAILTFALSLPHAPLSLNGILNQVFFTADGIVFLVVGTLIGGVLATIAFVFGVVTLPMMLDRRVDVFTAALVSALVVFRNKAVILTWAGLIAIFTGAGLAFFYVGLAVTLPLIGHASWHAYRACVNAEAWPATEA